MVCGGGVLFGQTQWVITDEDAEWSNNFQTTSGGTYDHSFETTEISGRRGSGALIGAGEGPIDGKAGIIWLNTELGMYTRSDAAGGSTDLSSVGSSFNIRAAAGLFIGQPNSYTNTLNSQHHMFGLTDSSGLFTTATNSLYVSLDSQDYDNLTNIGAADLRLYNGAGSDSDPTDGFFDGSAVATLASDISFFNAKQSSQANPGSYFIYDLTYTNVGSDLLEVGINVVLAGFDNRNGGDFAGVPTLIYSGTQTVANPFGDLTSLRPTFGAHSIDSTSAISGAAFDWEDENVAILQSVIPEPSSLLLVILGGVGLCQRRKR